MPDNYRIERFTEEDIREMVLRLAHEIRNPLATIKSGVQLVHHLIQPTAEIAEYLNCMLDEVSRIDRTVNDMQRFVRLDLSTAIALDVGELIEEVLQLKRNSAGDRDVSLRISLGPEQVRVLMDPAQFRDAVAELVDNAIRFSDPGGDVLISWEFMPDSKVAIHVDDEGPGISEAVEAKIMRPFFSTSTKGTGLGLNIVNRISHLYGGSLRWEHRNPMGSRFTLLLPVISRSSRKAGGEDLDQ